MPEVPIGNRAVVVVDRGWIWAGDVEEKDGKIIGMLSVNGYNGQIFLHTWHGTFIQEVE